MGEKKDMNELAKTESHIIYIFKKGYIYSREGSGSDVKYSNAAF